MKQNKSNKNNIIGAALVSLVFMLAWQYFYEAPRAKQKQEAALATLANDKAQTDKTQGEKTQLASSSVQGASRREKSDTLLPASFVLEEGSKNRMYFENSIVKGSIDGNGLRIDNLELKKYKGDKDANVTLLAPSGSQGQYFAEFGFASTDRSIILPTSKSPWQLKKISETEIVAKWTGSQNITFTTTFKLGADSYGINVAQSVKNDSGKEFPVAVYTRIYRSSPLKPEATFISHEGFIGYFGGRFNELKYDKLKDVKRLSYPRETEAFWVGFSDKYWLTAFAYNNEVCITSCQVIASDISLNYIKEGSRDRYQADFITDEITLTPSSLAIFPSRLFSGAKELDQLNNFASGAAPLIGSKYELKHFEKAVDFGIFYFLTKPIFLLITFLNSFLHNFGFSIILLTIIVKLILFPVATKSYLSMAKMKAIAPTVEKIKKEGGENKLEINRKVMELYREKQINPLSGCLPILLQIPVFFALYKVLYISIEMRGAPFIWWIKDLSMQDPTSIFNLFGILPFSVPSFLQIGVLPILMGLTTYLQQSLSPKTNDATQAMIMKSMPFILIFVFASFPAGIVLYWVTNNILSILQQLYVEKVVLPKVADKGTLNIKHIR